MFQVYRIASIALVGLSFGCKTSQSSLKTAENFARSGELKEVSCSGTLARPIINGVGLEKTLQAKLSSGEISQLSGFVEGALGNIPQNYLDFFFAKSGGAILLVADANATCSSLGDETERKYWAEQTQKIDACWHFVDSRPQIIVTAHPIAIKRHVVRMFGRMVVETFLPAAILDPQNSAAAQAFSAKLRQLSESFIHEIKANNAKGDKRLSLDIYANMLESGNATARAKFDTYVFAESFDSYFCAISPDVTPEKNTRTSYQALLPLTFGKFDTIIKDLQPPTQKVSMRAITVEDKLPAEFIGMRVPVDSSGNLQPVNIESSHYYRGRENDAEHFPALNEYATTLKTYGDNNRIDAHNGNWVAYPQPGVFTSSDPYWKKTLVPSGSFFAPDWTPSPVVIYKNYNTALAKRNAPPAKGWFSSLFGN